MLAAVLAAGMVIFYMVGEAGDADDPDAQVAGQSGFGGAADELMDLFYAATITATSVGYGDYNFGTQTGRVLGSVYAVVGVLVAGRGSR